MLDVNEHAPEFLVPNPHVNATHNIHLSRRTPVGRVLMKVPCASLPASASSRSTCCSRSFLEFTRIMLECSCVQVRASDPDDGENSRVEYRLLSVRRESDPETQQPQPFAIPLVIHLVSGDLLVNASLENLQTGYSSNIQSGPEQYCANYRMTR